MSLGEAVCRPGPEVLSQEEEGALSVFRGIASEIRRDGGQPNLAAMMAGLLPGGASVERDALDPRIARIRVGGACLVLREIPGPGGGIEVDFRHGAK